MDHIIETETISRLKFIGKIKKGDKINVKYMYTQTDNFFTRFSRSFLYQDNRSNTLTFIREIVMASLELLKKWYEELESNKSRCKNIIIDLKNCKTGLSNLKETYVYDLKFTCDVDILLEIITIKIEELTNSCVYSSEDEGHEHTEV